jgi:hypothetical protein
MNDQSQYTLVQDVTGPVDHYPKCPYMDLFRKYKHDCKIFFETGTCHGDSVVGAFELGFEKIISVELEKEMYDYTLERIASHPNSAEAFKRMHLFLGNSKDKMPEMLSLVDNKALFWIDAHYNNGAPAFDELEHIKNHPIKNHIIMIDDIPLYFTPTDRLLNAIKAINPAYQFKFEDSSTGRDAYHLAAFI